MQNIINNAKSLDDLLEMLNGFESSELKLVEAVDLSSLPVFGATEINADDVYSCDSTRYLIESVDVGFELINRSEFDENNPELVEESDLAELIDNWSKWAVTASVKSAWNGN